MSIAIGYEILGLVPASKYHHHQSNARFTLQSKQQEKLALSHSGMSKKQMSIAIGFEILGLVPASKYHHSQSFFVPQSHLFIPVPTTNSFQVCFDLPEWIHHNQRSIYLQWLAYFLPSHFDLLLYSQLQHSVSTEGVGQCS